MADVEKYAKDLIEITEAADDFKKKVAGACGGSFKWGIGKVVESYLSMFDRFCPFKEGDRVELVKDVNAKGGWAPSNHFLIKGSPGTITSRGYDDDKFTFYVEFDNETWVDREGEEQPVIHKHVFGFNEDWLIETDKPSNVPTEYPLHIHRHTHF